MFELLLQADKSMAAGLLDQAEKTYWQLVELDPTNAIAVAGLARVSLERGDERSARTFAEQALGIDPDSIAARRVIERVEHRAGDETRSALDALPLVAVERLEALSRRRSADSHAAEESGRAEGRAGHDKAGSGGTETSAENAGPGTAGPRTAAPARGGSRGRTRPDQVDPLPVEPLPERRKAGRLAAAAAAAAAAAREPVRARHKPHHAMPIGRRFFDPGALKAAASDEFSAAEMAAAVAAIDDVDENVGAETADAAAIADPQGSGTAEVLGAIDATEADESVALRLALLGDVDELDAAEAEAQSQAGVEPEVAPGEFDDEFEAAEAVARSQAGVERGSTPGEIDDELEAAAPSQAESGLEAEPGEFDDEFEAAEAVARSQAGLVVGARHAPEDPFALAETEALDVAVVEPASEGEAMAEAAGEVSVPPDEAATAEAEAAAGADFEFVVSAEPTETRIAPALPSVEHLGEEGPSEAEAEAQALREAMDIVLAGESSLAPSLVAEDRRSSDGGDEDAGGGASEPSKSTEPVPEALPIEGPGSNAESTAPADAGRTTPKRRGFFRRNKGS